MLDDNQLPNDPSKYTFELTDDGGEITAFIVEIDGDSDTGEEVPFADDLNIHSVCESTYMHNDELPKEEFRELLLKAGMTEAS